MKDYYAVLGVTPNAAPEVIESQYRAMMKACRPGWFASQRVKAAAEADTQEIGEAYGTLSDPVKRAAYDHAVVEARQREAQRRAREEADRMERINLEEARRKKDVEARRQAATRKTERMALAQREGLILTLAPGITLELVRVPAGEFLMGSAKSDHLTHDGEKPQHRVMLDEYLIGKYDVTNEQFDVYMKAIHRGWTMPWKRETHPVVYVAWDAAAAFCVWASQVTGRKLKLPSEAQWEKAARGTDGRIYPWGNQAPNEKLLNFDSSLLFGATTPVGKYSPAGDSPYGLADMAGNVWQWTADWYDLDYYAISPASNPTGPASGHYHVMRGGSYNRCGREDVRSANRHWFVSDEDYPCYGFRVAVNCSNNTDGTRC